MPRDGVVMMALFYRFFDFYRCFLPKEARLVSLSNYLDGKKQLFSKRE